MSGEMFDRVAESLGNRVADTVGEAGRARISALLAVRSVMPEADVYDRIRLARYILTGSEDEPQTIEVATADGIINRFPMPNDLQGQEPLPPEDPEPLTGVVGPDPDFEKQLEEEETPVDLLAQPAPSSGSGWRGRRER